MATTAQKRMIHTQKDNLFDTQKGSREIDCPFSMPTSRKERPAMTKPREKTREELTAPYSEEYRRAASSAAKYASTIS